jgi:hypothetical protein
MHQQSALGTIALLAAMTIAVTAAQAFDESKYPNLSGQWSRNRGSASWDQAKGGGLAQKPPLTPEYQAIYEARVASVATGSEVYNDQARCLPSGMPRMMIAYEPIEIIVTPKVTYVRVDQDGELRRIYTDGRDWPADLEPSFAGYSIGKWIDVDNDGRYDVLEVETRAIKGPHAYDANGIPFDKDDEAVIKERIHLDKDNPDMLRDDITSIDHALTQPWTVTRTFFRDKDNTPWHEHICEEDNHHVVIGKESYFLSADNLLMPTRKDQPPPDLKYFKQTGK